MSNQWLISKVDFGIIPADTNLNAAWGTVANWFTWRVTTTMAPQFRLDDRVQREWTLKAKAGIAMFKPLELPLF